MIPTPYSALANETALPSTAANFPACRLFLKANGAAGVSTMHDEISNTDISVAGSSASGTGFQTLAAGTVVGVLPTPIIIGTKFALLIASMELGTGTGGSIALRDSGIVNSYIGIGTASMLVYSGGVAYSSTLVSTTQTVTAVKVKPGTASSVQGFKASTTVNTTEAGVIGTPASMTTAMTDMAFTGTAGTLKLHGVAMFLFDTTTHADPEIQSIVAWCMGQWRTNNNKALYPGLVRIN